MDAATISAVVSEIAPLLVGRAPGKVFQTGGQSLAIDFGLREHGYLFISVEPAAPRLYLIKRRVRELEKASRPLTQFALSLRKELARTTLRSVQKTAEDRIVRFEFEGTTELGEQKKRTLIAQLTGRSANLLLLDEGNVILAQMREGVGPGQIIGEKHELPVAGRGTSPTNRGSHAGSPRGMVDSEGSLKGVRSPGVSAGKSVSEQLDTIYTNLANEKAIQAQQSAARAHLRKEISRRKRLLKQLESDLAENADAEQQKRIGDLLLANVGTAKRNGTTLKMIDYFAEGAPEIEIEVDEKLTVPEEASRRFKLYSRSKRARAQIAKRIKEVKAELSEWEMKREQLATSPNPTAAPQLAAAAQIKPRSGQRRDPRISGARRYVSSDGYEILVGRAARDNDTLTFKVAKPNDLWLHAADYPGSHVIIRNSTRKEIPHSTIIEGAQLAAYFSQASKDPKVDVHYTQRKFLSKPKGAAPGLVRMSQFKSITVAPAEAAQRTL